MQADILVVGGGIGGLTAALALARDGHRVRVLEKAAQFAELGAGLQLVNILKDAGLEPGPKRGDLERRRHVRGRLRPGTRARLPAFPGERHPAREGEHRHRYEGGSQLLHLHARLLHARLTVGSIVHVTLPGWGDAPVYAW